jgi:maltose/moltooligosaccharide transporter
MWVYTTPAVASQFYGASDPNSPAYQEAGNWVGILFGVYNGVAAIIALSLPVIASRIGKKLTHTPWRDHWRISYLSFAIIKDPVMLIIPMIGIGFAWGSILAMPYALLASSLPPKHMGVFMGLFNMSITIPQIVNGIFWRTHPEIPFQQQCNDLHPNGWCIDDSGCRQHRLYIGT